MKPTVVIGAGGHARVVVDALLAALRAGGELEPVAVVDAPDGDVTDVLGISVVGTDADLPRLLAEGVVAAAIGLGFISDATQRRLAHARALKLGFELPPIVHPRAVVSESAVLEAGCFIAAGAVIGAQARVGEGAIVNTNAVVDHDCVIGEFAHIAPLAALSGAVTVGAGTLVGVGASSVQCISIGADSVIGAGAAVIGDIPDGVTALGVPARVRQDTG